MKILGIDTSSKYCNLAVIENNDVLIEYTMNGQLKKHSSILIPTVQEMFNHIDMKIKDMDGVAITIGPGSFTGLRIGLGAAKGLCYATGIPLVGVYTLDVMAYPFQNVPGMICPVLDARKSEVYFALYRGGNDLKKIIGYQCNSIKELLNTVLDFKENIYFIGGGILKYEKILIDSLDKRAFFIKSKSTNLKASDVAFLGMDKLKKGQTSNISNISPFYIRKSEAEMAWERKFQK